MGEQVSTKRLSILPNGGTSQKNGNSLPWEFYVSHNQTLSALWIYFICEIPYLGHFQIVWIIPYLRLVTTEPQVQTRVTSRQIGCWRSRNVAVFREFLRSFLLIIIVPLLHTYLSPPLGVKYPWSVITLTHPQYLGHELHFCSGTWIQNKEGKFSYLIRNFRCMSFETSVQPISLIT
jgi:hypothetical protein